MTHDEALAKAREIATRVLAPHAAENDKTGRFPTEAIKSLGDGGLLGLMLPPDVGGSEVGPRTFAALPRILAETDASAAMIYLLHMMGGAAIAAARPDAAGGGNPALTEIGA